ncbi:MULTISPECIES: transposase [unclassified Mesorhizobium]|uniref:transposase n=1 Tax=unclassified Mesorhizobium TaxID=325217 RepID=UPI00333B2922
MLSRKLRDRRAVARYAGLTGSPDESGKRRREKGLARAGNARVRRGMIQLAWRFLLFQKDSDLARWFQARTTDGRKTTRTPQLAGPQQGLRMTIRGGGNPKLHMVVRTADVEWAPPPRSFATDAHAASWSDPLRSTAYKSAARPSRLARRARLGNLSSAFGPTGTGSTRPGKAGRPCS